MELAKSFSFDQQEILRWIRQLHCPEGFEVDCTFGNGGFYKSQSEWPIHRFDADPDLADCQNATSQNLPLSDNSVGSIIFDPPFLTYVKKGRTGNGNMVMAKRFSGYWAYGELEDHYRQSLSEFHRVLRPKDGLVIFKCQDVIHNHKIHPTHINVVQWADEIGFDLKDMFVLGAKHRMPRPGGEYQQRHARVFHCYFLILQKRRKS